MIGRARHQTSAAVVRLKDEVRQFRATADLFQMALAQRLFDRNGISRLGLLQRHVPNIRIGSTVVVTRREDVLRILGDPDTFPTAYGPRLPGPFVLGLDGPDHDRVRRALDAVLRPEDYDDLAHDAEKSAKAAVEAAQSRDPSILNLGSDLIRPLFSRVVANYVGISSPNEDQLWRWAHDIFEDIFLNSTERPEIRARGEAAGVLLVDHVDRLITRRRDTHDGPDDILGRLVGLRSSGDGALDDREIAINLIGLAIGWMWHGMRAVLIAMDELLSRPDELRRAQEAARRDDMAGLRHLLWETLRFRPVQAGLLRKCRFDVVLAPGTDRSLLVPSDAGLLVGTHAAMWDERDVPDPEKFDPSRSFEQYLIFGGAAHHCLGERIFRQQMPALLAPVLRVDGLCRAGRLRWSGAQTTDLPLRVA